MHLIDQPETREYSNNKKKSIFICVGNILICFMVLLSFAPQAFSYEQPISQYYNLDAFISEVLENSPQVHAAASKVIAAQARLKAASRPLYNPELAGDAQSSVEDSYSLGVNQTVDWMNKKAGYMQVAYTEVLIAQAQFYSTRQQIASDLLIALVNYNTNKQVERLSQNRVHLLQQFVTLTNKRLGNGDVPRVDLDLAELALSEAIAQQASTQVNTNQALEQLRSLTGYMNANWPILLDKLPQLDLSEAHLVELVNHLPSLQILNNQYLSAEAKIHLARKLRYPDPTLGLQGGYTKEGDERRRLIGGSISIPLFVRNSYTAQVDAANADAMEAAQNRLVLIRQAQAEIASSAERYQILSQAFGNWQELSSKPLNDGMVLIERLWQAGEISTTDYLIQIKQRTDNQIAGAELKGRAWQAWAMWLKVSGQSCLHLDHINT